MKKKMILQFMVVVSIGMMASMAQAEKLYETQFENGTEATLLNEELAAQWSLDTQTVLVTEENDATTFLNGWENGAANLTLTGLNKLLGDTPRNLTLTFDFYALDSWDGDSQASWGMDYFKITAGSQSNPTSFYDEQWTVKRGGSDRTASFDTYFNHPYEIHQYSGNKADWRNKKGQLLSEDTIYRNLSISFDHTGDSLQLIFKAIGLQSRFDESWGIDNVRVRVAREHSSVPEPGSFVLVAAGLLGLTGVMRRRTRAAS